jgi:phage repressor protein C with HTH and peptisase S24 domain
VVSESVPQRVDLSGQPVAYKLNVRAAAGLAANVDNAAYFADLPTQALNEADVGRGTFICLEVEGDSMNPTIYNGDWIIARRIDNNPVDVIKDDRVYVIVTSNGVIVKRVLNRLMRRQQLYIKSDNREFESYNLPAEDIVQVWEAKGLMRFNFSNRRDEIAMRVGDLEIAIQDILKRLPAPEINE